MRGWLAQALAIRMECNYAKYMAQKLAANNNSGGGGSGDGKRKTKNENNNNEEAGKKAAFSRARKL